MSKYTELITNYHATKPKFLAHVDLMTRPLIDVAAATRGLITAFDIDSAVGVQLDILGLWIGRRAGCNRTAYWCSHNNDIRDLYANPRNEKHYC